MEKLIRIKKIVNGIEQNVTILNPDYEKKDEYYFLREMDIPKKWNKSPSLKMELYRRAISSTLKKEIALDDIFFSYCREKISSAYVVHGKEKKRFSDHALPLGYCDYNEGIIVNLNNFLKA